MSQQSDFSLISRVVLLNDSKAFEGLVVKYQSSLRRFLLQLTAGNEPLSEDLAQETLIKAWISLSAFEARSGFGTWLFKIAYRVYFDHLRKEKSTVDLDHCKEIEYNDNGFSFENKESFERLLSTLSLKERTALLLFYMEDQSIDKISKIMNIPKGTVKSHLHRGKAKVSQQLKKSDDGK